MADDPEDDGDTPRPDPFEHLDGPDGSPDAFETDPGPDTDAGGTDPVDGLEPAADRGDPFESPGSPFDRVDVDEVDPDEVWEQFTATGLATLDGDGDEDEPGDRSTGDDVVTVPKQRFCETCPHFSAPPEVACGHEGTSVLEFVGEEEVRVANCPIVRERRELGEVHD